MLGQRLRRWPNIEPALAVYRDMLSAGVPDTPVITDIKKAPMSAPPPRPPPLLPSRGHPAIRHCTPPRRGANPRLSLSRLTDLTPIANYRLRFQNITPIILHQCSSVSFLWAGSRSTLVGADESHHFRLKAPPIIIPRQNHHLPTAGIKC